MKSPPVATTAEYRYAALSLGLFIITLPSILPETPEVNRSVETALKIIEAILEREGVNRSDYKDPNDYAKAAYAKVCEAYSSMEKPEDAN